MSLVGRWSSTVLIALGLVALVWPADLQATKGGHGTKPKPGGGKPPVKPPVKHPGPPGGRGRGGTGQGGGRTGTPGKPGGKGTKPPKTGGPKKPGAPREVDRLAKLIREFRRRHRMLGLQVELDDRKKTEWTMRKDRVRAISQDKTKTSKERDQAKRDYDEAVAEIKTCEKEIANLLGRQKRILIAVAGVRKRIAAILKALGALGGK